MENKENKTQNPPRNQQPPRGARVPGQKMDKQVLKRILGYLMQFKGRVIIALICILLGSVITVISSLALGRLIDEYIVPMVAAGSVDEGALLGFILKMAIIFVIGAIATYAYNRILVVVAQRVLKVIRDDMFAHMQTLPVRYFDSHTHGDIMSHYTNDTDTLRQLLTQSIPQTVSAVITIVASFITMLATSLWLTLFVIAFMFVMIKVTGKIAGKSGYFFVRQQEKLGDVNGYVEEMIQGQKVVKVFCYEDRAIDQFNEKNEELFDSARQANAFANMMGPLMANLGNLQYVLIAVLGAGLVALGVSNVSLAGVGALTLGNTVTFLQLSRSFTQTINQISQQLNAIVMAMAGAKRIFELMDTASEEDHGTVTLVNVKKNESGALEECKGRTHLWAWKVPTADGNTRFIELDGDVRLSHVDFGYVPEKIVLHDVTLYAEPGQKVAFVGSTGAGKTTITNLINRFYDIQNGDITYDGIPVADIKKDDLRRSLGIVLQDVNLFTGTIRENIRYGKLDATDEEVIEAAKLANAHDFISRLPQGYDTMIDGTGGQLSQGQRQLVSIARAAIADPPVMILDEATSSIDTRTEAIVQRGMDGLMHGRTVFVIAHRLSTVQNSDVIMVLEHGVIIERGSHDALIAEKGKYYQLYTGAFEME